MKYIKIKWLVTEPHGKQERVFDTISEKDYLEYELDKILGNFDDFNIESTELLIFVALIMAIIEFAIAILAFSN